MVSRRAGQSVVTLALLSALISWSGWDECFPVELWAPVECFPVEQ